MQPTTNDSQRYDMVISDIKRLDDRIYESDRLKYMDESRSSLKYV